VELFSVIEVMFRSQERICSDGSSPTRTCRGVVTEGGTEKTIGIPGSPFPAGVAVFCFALPPQPIVSSNRTGSARTHAALIPTAFKLYLLSENILASVGLLIAAQVRAIYTSSVAAGGPIPM